MMRRFARIVLSCLLLVGVGTLMVGPAGPAAADDCTGTWTIGVGGWTVGPQTSAFFGVQQPVGYNGIDAQAGLTELTRLAFAHRDQCPGDHLKIIGHSQGAGIVHAFVTAHPDLDNANAILLADPKRAPGPGSGGMSQILWWAGYPMAGLDDWFGDWPVLTICNADDGVCNLEGGSFLGNPSHTNYDFNVWDYGDWDSGIWFR